MSTKPTLYVQTTSQIPSSNLNVAEIRPATHDELIAAMPKCGTCAKPKPDGWCEEVVLNVNHNGMHERFGCTKHEEKPHDIPH